FSYSRLLLALHSFPTRRSSDLVSFGTISRIDPLHKCNCIRASTKIPNKIGFLVLGLRLRLPYHNLLLVQADSSEQAPLSHDPKGPFLARAAGMSIVPSNQYLKFLGPPPLFLHCRRYRRYVP